MSKSATLARIRSKARPASQRPRLVERELELAETRIRTIDTLTSTFILIGAVLSYVFVVILLDYWLRLNDVTRQMLWIIAGIGAAVYVGLRIVKPLLHRINPYFSARIIEKSSVDSKNGIINWLDLRDQPINPLIRDALSRRAVHEIDSADLDQALPTQKPMRYGVLLGVVLLGLIAFAWVLPDQFGSLVKRALFPFKPAIIPTHTRLEIIQPFKEPEPEVDTDTLPVGEFFVERGLPVSFAVLTHGVPPAEVFFKYQTPGDKAPLSKLMRQDKRGDTQQPWKLALSSSDIPVDGFEFWFEANDGKTRHYRLIVTSKTPPAVSDLDLKLTYPKYTHRRPSQQGMGPIKAIEGTVVDLMVTADRPVAKGQLDVVQEEYSTDGRPIESVLSQYKINLLPLPASSLQENTQLVLEKPFILDPSLIGRDGKKYSYRLILISPENRTGMSPNYPLDVEADLAPRVEIRKIKETVLMKDQDEIEVEANAVLPIVGIAHDDIAVGEVTLKLKTEDGRDLHFIGKAPLEKNLQKATGFAPPPVDYLLTLDLTKVTDDLKREPVGPVKFRKGEIVEMVVVASDTAEPKPHQGTSRLIKLKIKGKAEQKERKEQEKKAEDQQQKHEQQKKEKQEQQGGTNEDKQEQNDKQTSDKQTGDKQTGDKQAGDKQTGDKQTGDKQTGDKQTGDKQAGDKQAGDKQTGDKQTGDKQTGDKQTGDKQTGDKQTGDKQTGDKQTGDKQTGDKQTGDKQTGDKQTGDKQTGDKQTGDKQTGDKQTGDKQTGDKQTGDKQTGDKQTGDKQTGDKQTGDKQTGDKQTGDKQAGDKQTGDKQTGDKQTGDKQTGDKQAGDKQTGDKQTGDKQTGDKQADDKQTGDKQTGDKQTGDKQTGDKQTGDKQTGDKQTGDKQTGDKQTDKQKENEKSEPGNHGAGSGGGGNPDDKGDLSKLMEQVAKDQGKDKSNLKEPKPNNSKTNPPKADEVDAEAAKKNNLALDTLLDKLRRGDIDRKLGDKLKELNLTKEEAQKLVENKKLERRKSITQRESVGPNKDLTANKVRTDLTIDPTIDVPDELSSSFRSFTQKRNQIQPRK